MDAWVVEVLRVGYQILFDRQPPLSERPLSLPAYSPQSIKGVALTQELQTFFKRGQSNQPPQSPGFYSRLFRHPSQAWGQDASLPGRLAHPGLFGARLFTVEGQAPDSMYRTWHPGQPHEIVSSSHSITSVSRHGDSVSAFHSSTYSSTGRQSASSSGRSLHQHERAVGSSVRPPGLRTSLSGPVGGAVLRQYHHSRLSSSFRRDVLLHSERHGEGNPSMGRDQPCPSPASVHHGLVQCHSGHSESPQSGDRVRVDSPSGGSRSPCPQMAGGDRSFCDVTDHQASGVFLPGLRFEGSGDGRSSPALGQPPSLCLSSDRHHKESSCQTEVFEELRVDSHRSVLASEGLVPGPSGTVVRYSHSAAKSKRSSKPHFHRFHQNLPMLQLTVWRLSSDSLIRPASLLQWLDNLSSVEGSPHA